MNLTRYWYTLRYLKLKQILFQLWYRLKPIPKIKPPEVFASGDRSVINGWFSKEEYRIVDVHDLGVTFTFLNQTVNFTDIESINWNYPNNGKLWLYNLTYFDFLQDPNLSDEHKHDLIQSFLAGWDGIKDGLEPYPVTLRVMNLIKYASESETTRYDELIRNHIDMLRARLEYHLMGNHLLENAFALQMGAVFLSDISLQKFSSKLLLQELQEQILADGGHFERSPMYHRILLSRLLELIYLMQQAGSAAETISLLNGYVRRMLRWNNQLTFSSGRSPHFYDSQVGITYSSKQLEEYAAKLGIISENEMELSESGYHKYSGERYECIVNYSGIIADYIPGHAHADIFHFDLEVNGSPIFVDTGTSSYVDDRHRQFERSTAAHNTVTFESHDQSDMWGSFRVGQRARVIDIHENEGNISGSHDGYKRRFGIVHNRAIEFGKNKITITDKLLGKHRGQGIALFHLPPGISATRDGEIIKIGGIQVDFRGGDPQLETYQYAKGFNNRVVAQVISVPFRKELISSILL